MGESNVRNLLGGLFTILVGGFVLYLSLTVFALVFCERAQDNFCGLILPNIIIGLAILAVYSFWRKVREYENYPEFLKDELSKTSPIFVWIYKAIRRIAHE
ncbi:MAG: hypothetical protein PHH24_00820 [Candidatus Moranbacteria bacterium]|jgi:hypothetical protein|nr:hypothetical protein [Candidatus Moranbacteria bacterium]MDD5651790.1 hypothetical protein [Candidatus Moranbacteria bacterium]MDX9855799.1 hypothetical protein [Candidatus Moranbacteria bacterium]